MSDHNQPTAYKSKQREKCFELLARGYSNSEIAKELNVSAKTIGRWKAQYEKIKNNVPTKSLEIAQAKAQNSLEERINDLLTIALDTVEEILNDPDTRKTDKLRAIGLISDWARLGKSSKESDKEDDFDNFPIKVDGNETNLSNLSDGELKKLYFAKLNEAT